MRILYYNYTLQVAIGGGTHAREVLDALNKIANIHADGYPTAITNKSNTQNYKNKAKLRWLPSIFEQWVRFWYKPLQPEMMKLSNILTKKYDVILFRPNELIRMIPLIKTKHSSTHLCVEINSLIHAENLKNIWPNRLWIKKEINLIDKADSIMVVSEYLKMQLVQSGINPNKIMVNHNGVNPETFAGATTKQRNHARKALNLPDDSFVIGYVGGMEPFRKLPMMIRQIIEMMKNDSSIHFLMAGDGQDQSKINQIIAETRKGIQNRIHYNGTVPYDKIPALISSFDCAIFPYSNPYGSPQKIFEYMAMGIPVIGPNVPVVREIFENGRHLLLANQTGNDFIDLVKEIKDHTDTAHIMADNGCKLITEEFSWQNNARRLTEFISLKLEQF